MSASAQGQLGSTPWLDELNVEQRRAATSPGGPLLILAGAGTGKTTTLCARVAWLVSEGVAPERIMLLTFTRRAAREMLQRTRALVPMHAGSGVLGGTFHSVAHRFVRLHASALGLASGFGVLDAGDAADIQKLAAVGGSPDKVPLRSNGITAAAAQTRIRRTSWSRLIWKASNRTWANTAAASKASAR